MASSLMVLLEKYSSTNKEAMSKMAIATTTIRLSRTDKVLLMIFEMCRITAANIIKNVQKTLSVL
jgi:hypothetical protein